MCQEMDWITQSFWDKTTSITFPSETVTTKGLDEFYAEALKEAKNTVTKKAKEDAEKVLELSGKIEKLNLELSEVKSDLKSSENDLAHITEENINLEEFLEIQDINLSNYEAIKLKLKESFTIFNMFSKINKLKSLTKN